MSAANAWAWFGSGRPCSAKALSTDIGWLLSRAEPSAEVAPMVAVG